MKVYQNELKRLDDLFDLGYLSNKAMRLSRKILRQEQSIGFSLQLTRVQILTITESASAAFARDFNCLIEHGFLKIMMDSGEKVYVVNPSWVFNGSIESQQEAVKKYDQGILWTQSIKAKFDLAETLREMAENSPQRRSIKKARRRHLLKSQEQQQLP